MQIFAFGWRFNAKAGGGTLVKHYRELAFMGFVEVLFNLKTILGNIKICKMILPIQT
jgi:lipid A disaccharide synthetase